MTGMLPTGVSGDAVSATAGTGSSSPGVEMEIAYTQRGGEKSAAGRSYNKSTVGSTEGTGLQSATDAVKTIKQAQWVRLGPPQAVMFLNRAVKGTKLKTEAMELFRKLAPTIKPCSNHSFTTNNRSPILWNKQLRYGMRGGQPASYSGKEYSQLFKEITGALS
jgi:hypothetical protein